MLPSWAISAVPEKKCHLLRRLVKDMVEDSANSRCQIKKCCSRQETSIATGSRKKDLRDPEDLEPKSPGKSGGERGIRTPDTRKGIHAFEARAFSHSAISPRHNFIFILSGKLLASNLTRPISLH